MSSQPVKNKIGDIEDKLIQLNLLWAGAQASFSHNLNSYTLNGRCSSDRMRVLYDLGYMLAIIGSLKDELGVSQDDLKEKTEIGMNKMKLKLEAQ